MHARTPFRIVTLLVGMAWLAGAGPARAQTLTLAVGAPVTSIDPHFHNLTPNNALTAHIFDRLVDRDPQGRPIPGLATSWRLVDDRTWEFRLRDARFHDGTAFTAEDVAYTLRRVPQVKNSPGSFAAYTTAVTEVEIVDPHTVRLRTATVYPLLPVDLSQIAILSHTLGDAPATEDFNSGKDAIGTGPYRFVSYRPGDRIELERNDTYWGERPAWTHVSYRIVANDAARTAALLAGDVQFIDAVPTADLVRLRGTPAVALAETVSLRLVYLMLDQSHDGPAPSVTGPNGEALDRNPLKDRRVREALSIAMDRAAIDDRVMEGAAIPSGQFLPPGAFSYAAGLAPPAFDAARAKRLLAETGYPDGFRITLHGPNDRYVNDARIIQAIGQYWSRIGVRTTVEALPWTSFVGHANKQEYAAILVGWGSSSGEASSPLRALVATFDAARGFGSANRARYSNPAIDAKLAEALRTADDAAREALLVEATRMAMGDVSLIPIHMQKSIWGMAANLRYTPRADEETRAWDVRPAR